MSEHIHAARSRMEALSAQLDQEGRERMAQTVEHRQSIEETQRQTIQLGGLVEHSQVDTQRIDKGLTDFTRKCLQQRCSYRTFEGGHGA